MQYFKTRYAAMYKAQSRWVSQVVQDKKLRTPLGMMYFWPDAAITNHRSGKVNVKTEIFNYPVQGGATAEIIPCALIAFWYRIDGERIRILNTIHDSIVTEFHPEEEEKFKAIATQALTSDVFSILSSNYKYEFKVPLGVGIKTATHWGDTKKEISTNVWADGRTVTTIKE